MIALVFSAGGMYGAYQAGAWRALAPRLKPDIVIGASAGALNAWAVAGGASPEELAAAWMDPACRSFARLRLWQPPWRGCFDAAPLHRHIQSLWSRFRPRMPVAIVATEVPALVPRLFRDAEITWRHLAASCAVLLCYPQIRIAGRWYGDGGLLGALPLWAAVETGAAEAVAVNALPRMSSRLVRAGVGALRALAPWHAGKAAKPARVRIIEPAGPLGPMRDALFWRRESVERWIAQGEADAARLEF